MKEKHSNPLETSPKARFLGLFYCFGTWVGRLAMGIIVLVLLAVIFYQEENWRGKRAWEQAKAQAAASGKVVDYDKLIPPSVPDESNFFKAPNMQQWFTGRGNRDLSQRLSFQNFETWQQEPDTVVANVTIVSPDAVIAPGDADIVLRYHSGELKASDKPAKVTVIKPSSEIIPLIKMEEVPLADAIKNLCRVAGINYMLDPAIRFDELLTNVQVNVQPMITAKWTDHTALSALRILLKTNNLAISPDGANGIIRITTPDKAPQIAPDAELVLTKVEEAPEETEFGASTNVIPLIVMDEVPLTAAIKNLAKEAGIKYAFEKRLPYGLPDKNGNIVSEPTVSLRWTNLTALQALDAIVANYNMAMFPDPQTGIARIEIRDYSKTVLADKPLTERLGKMLADAFAPATNCDTGEHLTAALGFELSAKPLSETKPARVFVRADSVPYSTDVREFFPKHPLGENMPWNSETQARSTGSNTFQIYLNPSPRISAAKYLAWSDQFQDDFDAIREALKRPYARMEGDYTEPGKIPIPNFICARVTAQTVCQRAQCEMLLGQPEKALRDVMLVRDLCRFMEARPTGRPMTLIAAMINCAISGLYVQMIGDGLRLHVWREPELAALEQQLKEINLPPYLASALDFERIASCRSFENLTAENEHRVFSGSDETQTPLQKWQDPIYRFLLFAPRGWVYQNMATVYRFHQLNISGVDTANGLIVPHLADDASRRWEAIMKTHSPYITLAAVAVPNFTHASTTVARNQSLANMARVVCALERHHLARGNYPETLDTLAPQYIDSVPRDIIGGRPLKYHRDGDHFTLYSIGWNERDDGGVSAMKDQWTGDLTKADWLWPYSGNENKTSNNQR